MSYVDKDADRIVSLIGAVEQNSIYKDIELELHDICSNYKDHGIYLACTELSLIYGRNKNLFSEFKIYDTIDIAIRTLSASIQK